MVKLLDRVCSGLAVVAGALFLFVTFSICYSIITRALHAPSPVWIIQFNEYSMLWITFLGTAWLLPREKHIKIEILTVRLQGKKKRVLSIFSDVLGLLLCLSLFYFCSISTWEQYTRNIIDVQAIDIPKAFIVVVIPIGFLLLFLQFVRKLFEDLGIIKSQDQQAQSDSGKERAGYDKKALSHE